MQKLNKTILTDIDGVVLDWTTAFIHWMELKGYTPKDEWFGDYGLHKWYQLPEEKIKELVTEFNQSAHIGFIPPMPDSVHYIKLLADRGFKFIGITSLGDNYYSHLLRERNLKDYFGDAFQKVYCLPLRACKKDMLTQQAKFFGPHLKTIWIEDHIVNAQVGVDLGFETIVYAHLHNVEWKGKRAKNWLDIYREILALEEDYL